MERLTTRQLHILRQKLCDMKNRCYNTSHKFYKDYGGRGIAVCEEWKGKDGHKNFQKWALDSGWKEGYSIDRIDTNGNYEPSNCRWANAKEQANNRRNNYQVTIKGVTKNATEWAEEIGISERAFMSRIKCGWNEDRLLEPKYKPLKMSKAEMSKEIRKWRIAEEQGLLLWLPCKVGDNVYKIWSCGKNGKSVAEFRISHIDIDDLQNIEFAFISTKNISTSYWFCKIGDFGKTVFLTKEEAEQALANMKDERNGR